MESESKTLLDPRITEICNLLWGNNVTNDIFQRWSQGKGLYAVRDNSVAFLFKF